jgi:TRAP-type mannitol/chloroaromatic compound transport system substrate-binding protein
MATIRRISIILVVMFLLGTFTVTCYAAPKDQVFRWRYASFWPEVVSSWMVDEKFIELLKKFSAGRLDFKLFKGGELMPPGEVWGAVQKGTVPIGGASPIHWSGKDLAMEALSTMPGIMTADDFGLWLWQGEGFDLFQEQYAKHGLVAFPLWGCGIESGIRSNKPIHTVEDYKGLKIRLMGRVQGKIVAALGGSQVPLTGGEVYQALERGLVDAGEYGGPSIDWPMGFAEVTKYVCTPGWYQPATVIDCIVNQKAWNSLPDDLKALFKDTAMASWTWGTTYFEYWNPDAVEKFDKKGIITTELEPASLAKIQELSFKFMMEDCKANADYRKIRWSQIKWLKQFKKWRAQMGPFAYNHNAPGLDEAYHALKAMME